MNNFLNRTENFQELITYFKNKYHDVKKKIEIYETLTSKIESIHRVKTFGATKTSVTLSVTSVPMVVIATSVRVACALSLGNKTIYKIKLSK